MTLTTTVPYTGKYSGATLGAAATGATNPTPFPVDRIPAGTEDFTTIIHNQITAANAAGGGRVILGPYDYYLANPILMAGNVALVGQGGKTRLICLPAFYSNGGAFGGHPVISSNNATNVTVARLLVNPRGDTLGSTGMGGRLSAYIVEARGGSNVVFRGVSVHNPFTYSIVATGSSHVLVRNCYVAQSPGSKWTAASGGAQCDGIHIMNSHHCDVLYNRVDQQHGGSTNGDDALVAHENGAAVHDCLYAGNVVQGGSNGAGMQLAMTSGGRQIYNIDIWGNLFHNGSGVLHTGNYGAGGNTVDHITFQDNNCDTNNGGVNISGSTFFVAKNNRFCNSGGLSVNSGNGNSVEAPLGCAAAPPYSPP